MTKMMTDHTKVPNWLLAIVLTAILGIIVTCSASVIKTREEIIVLKTNYAHIVLCLERIEKKVDLLEKNKEDK